MLRWLPGPWAGRRPETDPDFGVVIPLDEAHLHSHSYRSRRRTESPGPQLDEDVVEGDGRSGDDDGRDKDGDDEGTGMLLMGRGVPEYSIEGLRAEVRRGGRGTKWTAYEMKSKLVNRAIQDIGMGRYHWQLFVLCGFGWFADNLWMQGVSLTLPSLSAEFGISEKSVRYTTSSLFVGLCLGSFFWGIGSDMMGRRIAFNITLLIASVFGTASAWAPSWRGVCLISLLTLLSVWWPIGQLCSSLLAWFFIAHWPADQGWRYFVMTMGIITFAMFLVRFFLFHMFESPKYLLSRGRQAEAVAVVQGIASRNGRKTWLTEEILDAVVDDPGARPARTRLSTTNIIKSWLTSFSADRIRPLFSTRKLGLTTALMWFCWATIGMGYPLFNAFLPQYLSHGGGGGGSSPADTPASELTGAAYRSYVITSLAGVPGSLLAAYTVDLQSPFFGRRGTLAIATLVSAVFLFLFVRLGTTPAAQLAFSCVEAFAQNIMYGVLYAFTPELFPAPVRGAGTGVASFLNRATGLLAPVLAATVPGDGTTAPVYLAAGLILAAFGGVCLIPIETRGRQRL
ncbi:MFS general substrate transporter [Trichocladium antarcticum]|uniref:MFS general substrate transporter n=1 Tax=Trichocladium antarcticum TaxID=1450529 RepID=A0AAN6ZGB3_9PEZI|nr:MFS general substrate transporter [Trichocladium antarcticum]